jgi:hypothetical protein
MDVIVLCFIMTTGIIAKFAGQWKSSLVTALFLRYQKRKDGIVNGRFTCYSEKATIILMKRHTVK